jgi:hypothetical protein
MLCISTPWMHEDEYSIDMCDQWPVGWALPLGSPYIRTHCCRSIQFQWNPSIAGKSLFLRKSCMLWTRRICRHLEILIILFTCISELHIFLDQLYFCTCIIYDLLKEKVQRGEIICQWHWKFSIWLQRRHNYVWIRVCLRSTHEEAGC